MNKNSIQPNVEAELELLINKPASGLAKKNFTKNFTNFQRREI
jgi:hypothetical protein